MPRIEIQYLNYPGDLLRGPVVPRTVHFVEWEEQARRDTIDYPPTMPRPLRTDPGPASVWHHYIGPRDVSRCFAAPWPACFAMLVGGDYRVTAARPSRRQFVGEIEARGYTAGGAPVKIAVEQSPAGWCLNFGEARWPLVTLRAAGVVYAAGDRLLCHCRFAVECGSNAGRFVIPPARLAIGALPHPGT